MSFEQIIQTFDAGGRVALEGFGAGRFDALAAAERERVFDVAAARLPAGQYDELAMQALGKLDLPRARALLERKLDEAPNAVCRAVALGALLDATGDARYEAALIDLLGADDAAVREKALTYLARVDGSPAVLAAFRRRLLAEEQAGLRGRLADEIVYRCGLVPRGRVDRVFVAWSERLAAADRAERERALHDLAAARPAG
jgi:hypothetical protein